MSNEKKVMKVTFKIPDRTKKPFDTLTQEVLDADPNNLTIPNGTSYFMYTEDTTTLDEAGQEQSQITWMSPRVYCGTILSIEEALRIIKPELEGYWKLEFYAKNPIPGTTSTRVSIGPDGSISVIGEPHHADIDNDHPNDMSLDEYMKSYESGKVR